MAELDTVSPLLDGLVLGDAIRDRQGISCRPALCPDTGERFAVKTISIPASQVQLEALLLTGALANELKAQEYFHKQAAAVVAEVELLDKVSKTEGFLPYQGTQTVKMQDGIGYEVYLLAPFRNSLEEQMHQQPLTHLAAVNLGLDMCAALAASRRAGYLYLNLKPSNIFVTENRGYCIGDLGFLPMASLAYTSYPEKYRSVYTAPEIQDAMSPMNDTLDIYTLGLTLYQVYNNGQLPFEDAYPDQPLPPPYYADYEMSAIILKACAPNPANRWQSPAQMGQALVDYMQRNSVNDVSLIPPPIELLQDSEDPEEFLSEEENDAELAELLAMIPEDSEPEPPASSAEEPDGPEAAATEADAQDLSTTEDGVTVEVAQMLAKADALIDHTLPEPVVAPDPIDVPIPPPLPVEADLPTEEPEPESIANATEIDQPEEDSPEDDSDADVDDEQERVTMPETEETKKSPTQLIIRLAAVVLLLVAIGAFGLYYYFNIYIQSIDSLSITGMEDQIVIRVDTKADSSKLNVTCTDAYGNTVQSALTSGVALFNGMKPDTQYRIEITISGHHKLTGETSGTYTTGSQTIIKNFTATTGAVDGTIQLNFDITGPDSERWNVEYSATNIPTKTVSFTGHSVELTGLTLGATYNFRISPETKLYIGGENTLSYRVLGTVVAEELVILPENYYTRLLQVEWKIPQGVTELTWTVRCYSDTGFDQTFETTANTQIFSLPGDNAVYTVILTAEGSSKSLTVTTEGMTPVDFESNPPVTPGPGGNDDPVNPNPGGNDDPVNPNPGGSDDPVNPNPGGNDDPVNPNPGGNDDPVDPNPGGNDDPVDPNPGGNDKPVEPEILTVTDFSNYLIVAPWNMQIQWNYTGPKPSGWILTYTTNGRDPITVKCSENYTNIVVAPDNEYVFEVRPIDNVRYNTISYTYISERHNYYAGNGFEAKSSEFQLITDGSTEPVFAVPSGDALYLYCTSDKVDSTVSQTITVTFSIRDSGNNVIGANSVKMEWSDMWQNGVCKLEIPSLPTEPGDYAVDLFFDYLFVTAEFFTVV